MFLTWGFAYEVIQHACTENTPWRSFMCWFGTGVWFAWPMRLRVDLFNRSVIQSTCTRQCMKEWNVNMASLQVFVSGLEVGIFRHLTIQFPFRVTTWFQNDSRCISIFSNSEIFNEFTELAAKFCVKILHKTIKHPQKVVKIIHNYFTVIS